MIACLIQLLVHKYHNIACNRHLVDADKWAPQAYEQGKCLKTDENILSAKY